MKRILFFSILAIILALFSITSGPDRTLSLPSQDILFNFRLPRLILAFLVGAGLSLSGACLQSVLRNNLASPFTLGVSSAASLGASIGIFLHLNNISITTLSILFCILSLLFLLFILNNKSLNREHVILTGVAIGFFSSAAILSLQFFGGEVISFSIQRWLIGSLDTIGFDSIKILSPLFIITTSILISKHRELDLLQLGYEFSTTKGINPKKEYKIILTTTAILVGSIVSIVGPISFVGLIIPNFIKINFGGLHKQILLKSLFLGAAFLILMDSLSKVILAPAEVPVGILCGLLGAPAFIWIMILEDKRS